MSDYTPTTDEVRFTYADYYNPPGSGGHAEGLREVDRWLAAHDREVAARALRKAVGGIRDYKEPGHWNLRDTADPEVSYSVDVWLEVRASRIERGEDV